MSQEAYVYEINPGVRLLQALDQPEVKKATYLLFLKSSRDEDCSNASHPPKFMSAE